MFRYYLLIALRNALRNKLYSLISIIGLSLGLTAVVLVGIYIDDELSYDRWIPDSSEIYQVMPTVNSQRVGFTPSDLGLWLRQDYPQLSEVSRVFRRPNQLSNGDLHFNESIAWVDSNFFRMFELEAVAGSIYSALAEPNNIVITEQIAEKYFGDDSALGKSLVLDREHPVQVAAILRDLPSNSHLSLTILAPGHARHSPLLEQDNNPVSSYFGAKLWAINTYIKTLPGVDVETIEADLDPMMDRHLPVARDGRKNSEIYELSLMPIESIHLAPSDITRGERDLSEIYTVFAISALILLAACINYINLMTARGMTRAPEIAIRKTVGASREDLVRQYLTESLLFVLVSFAVAVMLCSLLLPPLNGFLNRSIEFDLLTNLPLIMAATGAVLGTILLAGLYPALALARLSPLSTIRSSQGRAGGIGRGLLRKLLAVAQFAILTGLFIASITIYQQSRFAVAVTLNQTTDPVVLISTTCDQPLQQQLRMAPEVKATACTRQVPQWGLGPTTGLNWTGGENRSEPVSYASVDTGFFEMFDLGLAAGRYFDEARSADIIRHESQFAATTSIIVNETLVRQFELGSNEEAIGEVFTWSRSFQEPARFSPVHQVEIVGVLRDFQIGDVRRASPPAAFYVQRDQAGFIAVQLDGQRVASGLATIDEVWSSLYPNRPIRRSFFDQNTEARYSEITRQAWLLSICVGIAMLIAALGLLGLAAFVTEKRRKEIGIRKILGSSRFNIVRLLLWQFSKPVLISNLIAWPFAFYFLSRWLQGFASHVDLSLLVFLGASLATLILAMVTVFTYSFVVAGINPVRALRYE
ncbi:MAG: ABC transporter permease [Gammaproteobacteria bacterium]|nr:ABC transporter permease [Gammaproteobacteria bacterium]